MRKGKVNKEDHWSQFQRKGNMMGTFTDKFPKIIPSNPDFIKDESIVGHQ